MIKYKYICESCDKELVCDSPEEAFNEGWDIPPYMGSYGVLSPRTCPNCTIDRTLWWRVQANPAYEFTSHDIEIIERIRKEPEIFEVNVDDDI